MTTRILCSCCHQTLEVSGTHQFAKIEKCKNDTYVETTATGTVRIGAKKKELLKFFDVEQGRFVPLIAA